jgi:hypothetical protein
MIKAAIDGDSTLMRDRGSRERHAEGDLRSDGAACWMVNIGRDVEIA